MTPEEAIKIAIHCLGVQAEQEVCEECDIYGNCHTDCKDVAVVAIKALKEVQQYREIGTVEECRDAREKQIPKVPIRTKDGHLACECGIVIQLKNVRKALYFCTSCGQRIDWDSELDNFANENLEGMEDE